MSKVILHIDLNAFFATAERLRHPEWGEEPIIVGGDSIRGVVSTCSYSARKYGVKSAMPIFEAKRLCPKAHFLPCDMAYYQMLSNSFLTYLKNYSSLVEQASIDEAYVDLTKAISKDNDPLAFLKEIQDNLLEEIGLKSSLGVGCTKFLAKMASDMKKPMGITVLRKKDIPFLLYPLPVSSFYGIGKKGASELEKIGIKTIGELESSIEKDNPSLKKIFGKMLKTIKDDLKGEGDDVVNPLPFNAKSISHSETFSSDIDDIEIIKEKIFELEHRCYEEIKREGKSFKRVQLTVKDYNFKVYSRTYTFYEAPLEEKQIKKILYDLYDEHFSSLLLRLVGVSFEDLINPKRETVQMSLWNYSTFEEMDKTKLLVNELNRKMDKPVFTLLGDKNKK